MSTLDFSQITAVKLNGDTVVRITDTVNTLWELQQPAVDCLSFTDQSNAANTLTLKRVGTASTLNAVNVEYSFDKSTWTPWTESSNTRTLTIPAGGTVYLRGTNSKFNIDSDYNYYAFSSTGNVAGGGDVSALIAADGTATAVPDCFCYNMFRGMTTLTKAPAIGVSEFGYSSCRSMFNGCTNLSDVSLIDIPSISFTSGATFAFFSMFYKCTSIKAAPNLTITETADYCCQNMFNGCSAMTTAANVHLNATVVGEYSYAYMFQSCTSLKAAPNVTITETAYSCCFNMFASCSAMTTAANVHLNATDVGEYSYQNMFSGCKSLVTPPSFTQSPLSLSGSYAMCKMFGSCSSMTTAPAFEIASIGSGTTSSCSTMFNDCTSLTDVSNVVLSAPSLAKGCYYAMFYGCTSLTASPYIQATTLADGNGANNNGCLASMFYGCSKLAHIKVAFTSWKSSASSNNLYAYNWVKGVATSGTFECPSGLAVTRGISYIPSGWTIVNT